MDEYHPSSIPPEVNPDFSLLRCKTLIGFLFISFSFSFVQKQQTHPHYHPEPSRASGGRWRSVHRIHPTHTIHGRQWHAKDDAVRRDTRVAPPWWEVAECSLSSFGVTHSTHQVNISRLSYLVNMPLVVGKFRKQYLKRRYQVLSVFYLACHV